MPFLSPPFSSPLFVISSSQTSRQWVSPPCTQPGQEKEFETHESQQLGGTLSALSTLAARCSSENPTRGNTRRPKIPFFLGKSGGGSGGPPIREEGRALERGRSGSFGGKDIFLHGKREDVSPARKSGALPARTVSNFYSLKEVEMLRPVQVAESSGFVEGMSGAHIGAGPQVVGKNNEVPGIPDQKTRQIVYPIGERGQLPGDPFPEVSSDRRRGTLTVGFLNDRVQDLRVGDLFQVLLHKRGDETLTISDFNELLLSLVRHNELESAMSLFSELPSYGMSPNCWSFSIMIQCFCRKNDPDKAKDVLYDMTQNGFSPTTVLFTFLIHCFCKKGRLQSAYELLERMGKTGCHPTIQTYNCLMNGLCYVGRIEEAFQLLKKIKKSSTEPDIYSFTTVIDGFCKVGRTDEAIELLNDALELGIKPNVVTFNSLINGFCREGRPLEGVGLLRDMKGGDCKPDHISYGTLLQGLLKCGEVPAALKIYKEMREIGLNTEERVMNTLLRGICRKCMMNLEFLEEADGLFETIINMGYCLSPYTYCLMVQAFANRGHINKALAHLNEMTRIGLSPRTMTYNVVIRVLCGQGRVNDALLVLILMIKGNRIPSTFSCNRLLNEFNRQERFLDACSVYAAALKHGVHLCEQPRIQESSLKSGRDVF